MSARNRIVAITLAAAAALAVAQQVPFAPPPASVPATGPATGVAPEAVQPPQGMPPQVAAPQPGQPPQPTQPQAPKMSPQELDQLTAPIALYPDALLSQVLMASTYPLEVVQARRWTDANAALQGDPLAAALEQLTWDPSVKSLVTTPTVLQLMDDKIDWTVKLGDAFLAQQGEVMDSVQRLRKQAQAAGYLKDTEQQKVVTAPAEPTPAPSVTYYDNGSPQPQVVTQYVTIEDTQPDYVYVPVYDPVVVYGGWAYSSYRPFFWRPRAYVETRGVWYDRPYYAGPAWSYAWGRPDWRVRRLELDLSRAERDARNARIQRDRAYQDLRDRAAVQNRQRERGNDRDPDRRPDAASNGRGARAAQVAGVAGEIDWQHDTAHRRGVSYRDAATAQRFTNRPAPEAAAREASRARTDLANQTGQSRNDAARVAERAAADRAAAVQQRTNPGERRPVIPNGTRTPAARPDRTEPSAADRNRTRPQTADRATTPDRAATPDRTATPARPATPPRSVAPDRAAASPDTAGRGDRSGNDAGSPRPAQQSGGRDATPDRGGRTHSQPSAPSQAQPTPAPRQAAPAQPTPAPRAAPAPAPTPAPRAAPTPAPRPAPTPAPAPAPAPPPRAIQPAPAPRQEAPSRGSAPERPSAPPAAERGGSGRDTGSSGSSGSSSGSRSGSSGGGDAGSSRSRSR